MELTYTTLRFLHFAGFVLWGMGLAASIVGTVIAGSDNDKGLQQARGILKKLAHPGMGLAFVGGIGMIVLHPAVMKQAWLHGKFVLLAGLLAVTVLHGKSLRLGNIQIDKAQKYGMIARILTILILALAVFKPF